MEILAKDFIKLILVLYGIPILGIIGLIFLMFKMANE